MVRISKTHLLFLTQLFVRTALLFQWKDLHDAIPAPFLTARVYFFYIHNDYNQTCPGGPLDSLHVSCT